MCLDERRIYLLTIDYLQQQIETVRSEMYDAYNNSVEYGELVKISQELDELLNQLDKLIY
ncbi:aspartyl-phosphate phosphatase Spo0E family protein [Halobacillus salinus]|uniref:aspartyl-phosphate phosphatase Spo0E family protein n=1 Tax=Halobacillus salinus TaxID=192814 RepID=UPI0026DAE8EB|nr:aspartyl-phosphate phosphatase Spo0E family protein [Halobacillus salinus]